jgi:hypothetical protein
VRSIERSLRRRLDAVCQHDDLGRSIDRSPQRPIRTLGRHDVLESGLGRRFLLRLLQVQLLRHQRVEHALLELGGELLARRLVPALVPVD